MFWNNPDFGELSRVGGRSLPLAEQVGRGPWRQAVGRDTRHDPANIHDSGIWPLWRTGTRALSGVAGPLGFLWLDHLLRLSALHKHQDNRGDRRHEQPSSRSTIIQGAVTPASSSQDSGRLDYSGRGYPFVEQKPFAADRHCASCNFPTRVRLQRKSETRAMSFRVRTARVFLIKRSSSSQTSSKALFRANITPAS
jgi:hypothetical protein